MESDLREKRVAMAIPGPTNDTNTQRHTARIRAKLVTEVAVPYFQTARVLIRMTATREKATTVAADAMAMLQKRTVSMERFRSRREIATTTAPAPRPSSARPMTR